MKTVTDADHDLAKGWGRGGLSGLRVKDSALTLLSGPCVVTLISARAFDLAPCLSPNK